MDLNNLMWYGRHSTEKDEDGKPLDRDNIPHEDQPIGPEGWTRRLAVPWRSRLPVSASPVDMPVTLATKSIQRCGSIEHQIDEMLTYAKHYVEPDLVCMNGGFYGHGMHDCLGEHGLKFTSRLRARPPVIIDDLKEAAIHYDLDYNAVGYDSASARSSPERGGVVADHDALRKADRAGRDGPIAGIGEVCYTNPNPEEFGGFEIGRRYRQRWTIETAYWLMKHDFTAKSASELRSRRELIANIMFICHEMWMALNVTYAIENDRLVKGDQGRYPFTAHQFMAAMLLDI